MLECELYTALLGFPRSVCCRFLDFHNPLFCKFGKVTRKIVLLLNAHKAYPKFAKLKRSQTLGNLQKFKINLLS